MDVDPANPHELGLIANEMRARVLEGNLSFPSETGSWQLGDIDLAEYVERYRGKHLTLILASEGDAPAPTYTCGICGFLMNEAGDCPRCKLAGQEFQRLMEDPNSPDVFDQVLDLLDGEGTQGPDHL